MLINLNFHVRETGVNDRLYTHVNTSDQPVLETGVKDRVYAHAQRLVPQLYDTLSLHRIEHLQEAGDVSACYVQLSLSEFWLISRAEVATPPALEALPGTKRTPLSCRYWVASRVVGMLAPSQTAVTPLATSAFGPYAAAFVILCGRSCSLVLGQSCALDFFDFLEEGYVDSLGIIDPAGGIGAGDNLSAQLLSLLDRIDSDVAGTGYSDGLACEIHVVALKKFLSQIYEAVAGSLGSCQGSAVSEALTGQKP